jgi:hypothetical protein
MISECAWCKKELKYHTGCDHRISHGLCCDCVSGNDFSMGSSLIGYTDSLIKPVLIIDEELRILYANTATLTYFNKKTVEDNDYIVGDFFECIYTRLPYSCGHTYHCTVCTLRNAVEQTFYQQKMRVNTPVAITKHLDDNFIDFNMMVSTENAGDVVLLQVDIVFPIINEELTQSLIIDEFADMTRVSN